jgi:hypothetical protein
MFKLHHLTSAIAILSLAAGIATASAAETGTKTMPDSSIYPPRTRPPVYGHAPMYNYQRTPRLYNYAGPRRLYRGCYSPSGRC